jgi:hypothetical protein
MGRQRAGQQLALDVLYHEIAGTLIVELADARVIERGDGAGLLFEPLGYLRVPELDGHVAVHARIARLPHLSHPARADEGHDFVKREERAVP